MINFQVLHLTKIKTLFFVFVFTALSMATPAIAHFFGGVAAGRMFLPMQFFVLVVGLLLGWQAGLAVGILTPFVSYFLTGMPPVMVLPFVIIESAAYGLFAGLFQQKIKNIRWALVGSLVGGRMIVFLSVAILPTKLMAVPYIFGAIKDGWRGILLQIILVPVMVAAIAKFLRDERV